MSQDYTMKQQINPTAVASLFQQKAADEQAAQVQASQQKQKTLMDVIGQANTLVSTSIAASKERQKSDFIKSLAESMSSGLSDQQQANSTQTFPKPVSSMVPPTYTVAQPLQPTAEGNSIQALAATDPDGFMKQVGQTVLQTPQEKAANTVKMLTAQKDMQNLKDNAAPVSPATKGLLGLAYKKLGQPVPDITGMTDKQAKQHYLDTVKLLADNKSDLGISEKQQQFDENKLKQFGDATNFEKTARGASGQAAQAIRGVGQLKALFDGYKDNLTPQEWEEAATAWNRVLSSGGGTASREGIQALIPKTAVGDVKKVMQWYKNEPTGTDQQKFAQRMRVGMDREAAYNTDYLKTKTLDLMGSHLPSLSRLDPSTVKEQLEAKGLTAQDVAKRYPGLAKRVWGDQSMSQGLNIDTNALDAELKRRGAI